MSTLVFACPKTGRSIESGIEVEQDTYVLVRSARIRVRCIHCGGEHENVVKEARLKGVA